MPRLLLPLLIAALLAIPAQAASLFGGHVVHDEDGSPMVTGSGKRVTQARQVAGFDSIQSKSAVELDITVGPQTSASVEFDDNLVQDITTEVHGKTLLIDSKGSWTADKDPHVRITLPALNALSSEGSGEASITGLNGGDLALRLVGSADIRAKGHVASLSVLLNGSGDLRLYDLPADTVKLRLNGSGDIEVTANKTLEAAVYGSGDIKYRGNAAVTQQVYGSGSIEKK